VLFSVSHFYFHANKPIILCCHVSLVLYFVRIPAARGNTSTANATGVQAHQNDTVSRPKSLFRLPSDQGRHQIPVAHIHHLCTQRCVCEWSHSMKLSNTIGRLAHVHGNMLLTAKNKLILFSPWSSGLILSWSMWSVQTHQFSPASYAPSAPYRSIIRCCCNWTIWGPNTTLLLLQLCFYDDYVDDTLFYRLNSTQRHIVVKAI
jgi:hypothetical protein